MNPNPYVPLALVGFLSQISEERNARNQIAPNSTNVTIVLHRGQDIKSEGFAISSPAHWDEMAGKLVTLIQDNPDSDTVTIIYATDDRDLDLGVVLSRKDEPVYISWAHGRRFILKPAQPAEASQIEKGVGVEIAQSLLKTRN